MGTVNVNAIIEQYGGFDGAVVLGMGFDLGVSNLDRSVWIILRAYCEYADEGLPDWYSLRIEARGNVVHAWEEAPWNTNLVLNYPVTIVQLDERIVIDFDPLHAVGVRDGGLSRFYLGGESIDIQVISAPSACT
ncbi:hypothetical protein GCM10007907_18310 [Chitinimonas prasina]|uniref:Uncharacterized protein n=1 Tax=Chitinimonas prasina TaxID=1434937 RepID=A0ABQ5YDK0_9NEIS|nr:hypothetical protein GCM10007907_18310 [Chitinimonas prasina]